MNQKNASKSNKIHKVRAYISIFRKTKKVFIQMSLIQKNLGPTLGGAIMRSKPVDGCRIQSPVAFVDLAVRSFLCFSPKLA